MYYQDYKYPIKYELYVHRDEVSIYLDILRGKVKAVDRIKDKVMYYDIDSLPKSIHGVSRERILDKFKN